MGFHKAHKTGSTRINEGTEKEPKLVKVKFEAGQILEDYKKGTFEHLPEDVMEYNTGNPPKEGEDSSEEEESSEGGS